MYDLNTDVAELNDLSTVVYNDYADTGSRYENAPAMQVADHDIEYYGGEPKKLHVLNAG